MRKQRGPRFFAGFGIVGLFFSIILIQSTIQSYNSNKSKYPAAVATYQAGLKTYPTAVATYQADLKAYQAAVAKHTQPAPKAPHKPNVPTAPVKPELSPASFGLPILYIVLSLAYLFLAYRASQKKRALPTAR